MIGTLLFVGLCLLCWKAIEGTEWLLKKIGEYVGRTE